MTRVGVVTFPGTLDDRDAARAVEIAGAQAVSLWHKDADLHGVDAVVIPGGFSYGDYLRCGAIAATAGMIFPSLCIITIIAAFIQQFAHLAIVQHAFAVLDRKSVV